jgi:hypothetical protein
MRVLIVLAAVCGSLATGMGCRREVTSTVTGKVEYDGQLLNSGYITFQVNGLVTKGAEVGADGNYSVAGLPYGMAAVSIYVTQPPPPPPDGITPTAIPGTFEANPVLIPEKYGMFESSGISTKIAMPEQTFDIYLAKPGREKQK